MLLATQIIVHLCLLVSISTKINDDDVYLIDFLVNKISLLIFYVYSFIIAFLYSAGLPKKPGQCPYLVPSNGACEWSCRTDAECGPAERCCATGCGTACTKAVHQTACQQRRYLHNIDTYLTSRLFPNGGS